MTIKTLKRADGSFVSYEKIEGNKPFGIIYLHGMYSSKKALKAEFVKQFAEKNGLSYLSVDYCGHGESSGTVEDFRVGQCLTDVMDVIKADFDRPFIAVGSSLGGWIGLLLAVRMPSLVKALTLLAPGPDFLRDIWEGYLSDERKQFLKNGGILREKVDPIDFCLTYPMFEEAEPYFLLHDKIHYKGPVAILHGDQDNLIPPEKMFQIKDALESDNVTLYMIKGATHRLSDERSLHLLNRVLSDFVKEEK